MAPDSTFLIPDLLTTEESIARILAEYAVFSKASELSLVRQPELAASYDRLMAIFNQRHTFSDQEKILSDARIETIRDDLRSLLAETHLQSEKDQVRRYLETSASDADAFADTWLTPGFKDLLAGHVRRWRARGLLQDGDNRPIVMVGGGALPQSQVYLHQETGRTVITVDRDEEAVGLARDILQKMGMSEKLPVAHACGCEYDYADTAIVVVAYLVTCKGDVATRVSETSRNTHLTLRSPRGLNAIWLEQVSEENLLATGWRLADSWTPSATSSVSALTFAPQGRNASTR